MENYIDDSRIHEGHRGRMRAKLFSHGQRIFDTYELLEMLLYQVIPYKDTNPISKRLLAAFGGLDGVLSASKEELTKVNGIGERTAEFITSVGQLSDIIGAEIIPESTHNFSNYESVGEYLVDYFSRVNEKCVVAMFLDSSMRLISIKKLYDLEYDSGGVKAKAFINEAIKTRATVVISAHNHPFGPFYPTQGDRATNGMITDALTMAGFVHAEHYLVSGYRYAGIGSLKNFSSKLSQMPAVSDFIESRDRINGALCCVSAVSNDLSNIRGYEPVGYNKADMDYFAALLQPCAGKYSYEYAKLLLEKYKTIEYVFTASAGELISLLNEKCAFCLKLLAYVTSRRKTDQFCFGKKYTRAEIADYLKALFLGESVEKTYLICFNEFECVIGCEMLSEGTVNSSEIMPRKAVEIALGLSAKSVALAHNHPFGITKASGDDINLTAHMATIFDSCEIKLTDHYIVAGQLCDTIKL